MIKPCEPRLSPWRAWIANAKKIGRPLALPLRKPKYWWGANTLLLGALLLLDSCATAPPRNPDDACAIFEQYGDWFTDANAASQRWGVPLPVLLAIIYHESAFQADAQPPRTWYLGFIPGPRPSSAYGYSQALDKTWEHYIAATGRRDADRDEFADAVDFVGWYVSETARINGIAKNDAYNQYLAYHEGQGGFAKRTYQNKPWLMKRARQVSQRAHRYHTQLARCKPRSKRWNSI
ncbi:MAG: transglycosylase SLT domain-containing protein [Phycisphaerales bacterium]|nr:transglycosylase SLT domain-containing protein [Phycisphaerales bacterium]